MSTIRRAHVATFSFSILGLLVVLFHAPYTPFLLPDILFYLLLLVHTYLSIDLFSRIQTTDLPQFTVDAALTISYISLVLCIGTPVAFLFANLCLFIAAPIKYTLLIEQIPHPVLLRRKILVDLSGAALAALTLGIALYGYTLLAAWMLPILFGFASVRYLVTHPLYKI
jgi:hypothetical protein